MDAEKRAVEFRNLHLLYVALAGIVGTGISKACDLAQEAFITALLEARKAGVEEGRKAGLEEAAGVAGIYIASKARHGERWRDFRAAGHPIISTWIDESGEGQTADYHDLWMRCLSEAAHASVTIVYHEDGEVLKGALLEAGAALSHGRQVIIVGNPPGTWVRHRSVSHAVDIETAFLMAASAIRAKAGETAHD